MNDRNQLGLLLLVELAALGGLSLLGDLNAHVYEFLLLFAIASITFLGSLRKLRTMGLRLRTLIMVSLVLRAPLLLTEPSLSDDVWRYLHDGRMQIARINPYRFAPLDPATESARGAEFPRINHPALPTIYPPFAQMSFALAAVMGGTLAGWKLLLLLFDLATIALLFRYDRQSGGSGAAAALYAWHPLIIVEFSGSAHMDVIAFPPLIAGLLLLSLGRQLPAGLALGAAIAAKLLPAAYLPLLFRRNRAPLFALAGLTVVSSYLLYGLAEGLPIGGSLATFAENWRSNASLYALLERMLGGHDARRVALAFALAWIGWLAWRREPELRALLSATLAVLLLSPVVHPWYVAWLVPLLVIRYGARPRVDPAGDHTAHAALVWSFTCVLAYTVLPGYAGTGLWQVPAWAIRAEYIPVFALLAAALIRARRHSSRSSTLPAA